MGITRQRFDVIKGAWGGVGSWAVWADARPGEGVKARVGDLSVLDPDANPGLLAALNPEVVMLGINGSGAPTPEPFSNFHDPSPRANHFKLRYAYRGTPFWGAYLTDTFKGIPSYGAKGTIEYLRAHPDIVELQLQRLCEELDALGAEDPLLIAFGRDVHGILQENLGDRYRIARVPHYAHFLGKEAYRAQALAGIDQCLVAAARPRGVRRPV
ncbi:hypothetical protein [Microbacterium sp.]|uniref:hypothetical protein n=1 Tax=Microbacterium sp. TaxID=51671 RepID=UPI003A9181E6